MEATYSSEKSVPFYETTWILIREGRTLRNKMYLLLKFQEIIVKIQQLGTILKGNKVWNTEIE
jgi:hypothetical protein